MKLNGRSPTLSSDWHAPPPIKVTLPEPYPRQADLVFSDHKRIYAMCGRQGGKTSGLGIRACRDFLNGKVVVYLAPTEAQAVRFWDVVKKVLRPGLDTAFRLINNPKHVEMMDETDASITARTARDVNTVRGGNCDVLMLDEYAIMDEEMWESVGSPMLVARNGTAIFCTTPASIFTSKNTRATDKRHANKLWAKAAEDPSWLTIKFATRDNPYITDEAYERLSEDMTDLRKRIELDAEIIDEAPWALWKREGIAHEAPPSATAYDRVAVGVDPSGSATDGVCGIVVAGSIGDRHYVIDDTSISATPAQWATAVVEAYHNHDASAIVVERNYGGDMVRSTIANVDPDVWIEEVHASRGKLLRAEPVAALYENGKVSHVRELPDLEEQMCMWYQDCGWSPDRLDAMVWAVTWLNDHSGIGDIADALTISRIR